MNSQEISPQDSWIKTESGFQVENFFVLKLDLRYVSPPRDDAPPALCKCDFDFKLGVHNSDKNRFRLTFAVKVEELATDRTPSGKNVEAKIIGFFAVDAGTEKAEAEKRVKLNGLSVLYGVLRGIVVSATGSFPGGSFMLPLIMPQQIVEEVEKREMARLESQAGEKNPSKKRLAEPTAAST